MYCYSSPGPSPLSVSADNLDHAAVTDLDCYIHTCGGAPGQIVHPNTEAVPSHTVWQLLLNADMTIATRCTKMSWRRWAMMI